MGTTPRTRTPAAKTAGPGATGKKKETPLPASPPPPASNARKLGELAKDYLGDIAAADELAELLEIAARLAATDRLTGIGATRRRPLVTASKAAERLAKALGRIETATLIRTLLPATQDAAGGPQHAAESLLDDLAKEPLHRKVAAVSRVPQLCQALGQRLAAAAAEGERLGKGRPTRPDALNFALDRLLAIWRRHGRGEATQGATRGRFGGLATALLADEPCGFGENTVRHAVAALLPSSPQRDADTAAVGAAVGDRPQRVLVVGTDTRLGGAIVAQYEAAGAIVRSAAWPAPKSAAYGDLVEAPAEAPLDVAPPASAEAIDVVVIVPRDLVRAIENPADLLSAVALIPDQVARSILAQHAPRKLVLVAPVVPVTALGLTDDWRTRRAARATQLSLMQSLAASALPRGTIVLAVTPAWGTDPDGLPYRQSTPGGEARILVETISGAGESHAGQLLDLHGSRMPT